MTSSGVHQRKKRVPNRLVFSNAHKGRACLPCTLCHESLEQYTHPVIWKNPNILPFVNKICGEETIHLDSCTCWNYGDMCMDVMRKHTSRPNLQARMLYYRHCVRVQTWPHYLRTMSVQNVLLFVSSITVHFTK